MSDERKPLLSDVDLAYIAYDGKPEAGSVMPVEKAVTIVRDYYESLISEGKLRVVEEVELVWRVNERNIGCHYCSFCDRPHPMTIGLKEGNYCPGCGNKIKQP